MDFLADDGVNIDDPLSFDFFGFDFDFKGKGERDSARKMEFDADDGHL